MTKPTNKTWQISHELKIFICCYCISRVFFLLTPGYTYDFYEFAVWGDALLQGKNIYTEFAAIPQGVLTLKYPPLFFVQCALIILLFGHYAWSIRLGFISFEILTIITLDRFLRKFSTGDMKPNTQSKSNISILYLFAFSPATIFNLLIPQPYFLGGFYMFAGLMAFYLEKPKILGLFIAIGFLTEYFPIFTLIPIIIYYFSQKKWKEFFQMAFAFLLVAIISCIPFILMNPQSFLSEFLIHLSRIPQTASFWNLLESNFNLGSISLFGVLELNYLGIAFIAFVTIFSVLSFFYLKNKASVQRSHVLWLILIFLFCIPLVFMSFDMRYFYWLFPIACLYYAQSSSSIDTKKIALPSIILSIVYGLVFLIFWPNLIAMDQRILLPNEQLGALLNFSLLLLAIIIPFYLIYWYGIGERLRLTRFEIKEPNLHQVISISLGIFLIEVFITPFNALWSDLLFFLTFAIGFALNVKILVFLVKSLRKNWGFF